MLFKFLLATVLVSFCVLLQVQPSTATGFESSLNFEVRTGTNETEEECVPPAAWEHWLSAVGATVIISLVPLLTILIIPIQSRFKGVIVVVLLGFAVGALLGDVVFHLIPEVLGVHSHSEAEEEEGHEHHEEEESSINVTGMMATMFCGIICFYIIEALLRHRLQNMGEEEGRVEQHELEEEKVGSGGREGDVMMEVIPMEKLNSAASIELDVVAHEGHQHVHDARHCPLHFDSTSLDFGTVRIGERKTLYCTLVHDCENCADVSSSSSSNSSSTAAVPEEEKSLGKSFPYEIGIKNNALAHLFTITPATGTIREGESVSVAVECHALEPISIHDLHIVAHVHDVETVVATICINAVLTRPESSTRRKKAEGYLNLFADSLHNFVDGVAIGVAFASSLNIGLATSLAVLVHEIPQELADFGVLVHAGFSKFQAVLLNVLVACFAILGALIGSAVGTADAASPYLLAFTGGGFLYISLVNMVPVMLQQRGKTAVAVFFSMGVGMVILLILSLYEIAAPACGESH